MAHSTSGGLIKVRYSKERGHANHGWLDTYHTFSFADYYDPRHVGFRSLRVINEDRVSPGRGFGTHSHKDMEILSYVVSGALKHRDSMGHESIIGVGKVQKITAGSGISHSEFNASTSESVHFLQIWIEPKTKGLAPSYQELTLPDLAGAGTLRLIGSPESSDKVVFFNQDVLVYKGELQAGQSVSYSLRPSRGVWVQVIRGRIEINGAILDIGDGASIEDVSEFAIVHAQSHDSLASEFLVFDLA